MYYCMLYVLKGIMHHVVLYVITRRLGEHKFENNLQAKFKTKG